MRQSVLLLPLTGSLLTLSLLPGCGGRPAAQTESEPQAVYVSQPVQRDVTDFAEFTGRTDSVNAVEIRPRVTGYLKRTPFKEGTVVKKDDVLFEIDDRPYKDDLDRAKAEVKLQQAALVKNQADLEIALNIKKENPDAVSQRDINKRQGSRDESAASLEAAKATAARSQLNYDWCKVRSPSAGRVSRYDVTAGNLVTQDATVLTTVVSEDPIYAYFDVDERTMLHILRKLVPSKINLLATQKFPVYMALADEKDFPHAGYVDFANNVVSPTTGTITTRGVFQNPAGPTGLRLLRPGMFVRIRLPLGKARPALLVADEAVAPDQGQKNAYVVDANNVVQYKRVKLGPLQDHGLRVIEEGLSPTDRVIVSGLQLVRPRMEVRPELVPMPGLPRSGDKGGQGPAKGPG